MLDGAPPAAAPESPSRTPRPIVPWRAIFSRFRCLQTIPEDHRMSIKLRLTVMNFLQFFVWGAWLISLGGYMIVTLGFTGGEVGNVYATMGIASLFMPGL